MQRVQIWKRFVLPLIVIDLICTLAPKLRLVRGALRCQRPECWWRMLRPNVVPLPQISQDVAIASVRYQTRALTDKGQRLHGTRVGDLQVRLPAAAVSRHAAAGYDAASILGDR